MPGSLLPLAKQIALDNSANPGVGYQFFTYEAGTLTPKATYQDAALTTANANPVVANARGEVKMYGSGNYRIILKDQDGNTIWDEPDVPVGVNAGLVTLDGISLEVFTKDRLTRVISSVGDLRAINKAKYTKVLVTGYYADGDGGGGLYYYDSTDTASADNGGTVIVATDGGRWKMAHNGELSVKQFGAKQDGATDDTTAVYRALAVGGVIWISGPCRIEAATVLSLAGENRLAIGSNTHLRFAPAGRFLINSNQLADGTRFEITGTNVTITNGRFSEINATLGRHNVYGTLSGNGCTDVKLDHVEVDGANGAGVHFRNNCSRVALINLRVINTKADGLHIQRGSSKFRIVTPYFEANEDDCIGIVSHGRNDGYSRVSDIEIIGGYYGAQANGAVGSGIGIIGAANVRVVSPRCISNGLSGIRIADWVSASEGSYAPANITIVSPVCHSSGQTSSGAAGVVKDGITVLNARNVRITDADIVGPVNHGIVVSGAGIDISIARPKVRQAGSRGIWVAASFKTDAHILELATTFGDSRYTSPAQLGCEYLRIDGADVDATFNDGIYLDGSTSTALLYPAFRNLKAARSNRGNTTGKYGLYIAYTSQMDLDGAEGGASASATALQASLAFVSASYTRITNLAAIYTSHTYPTRQNGDRKEFWNSAAPSASPAVGPGYKLGDLVWNTNPGSGTTYWVCTAEGGAGTWAARA